MVEVTYRFDAEVLESTVAYVAETLRVVVPVNVFRRAREVALS